MLARRRVAAAALVLPLLTGLAACGDDDGAEEQVPGQVEDVAPGTAEEGVPEDPLQEGTPAVEAPVEPSEGTG